MNMIQNIYIDEYGDTNLETAKEGVSNKYILTAVLVDENILVAENDKAKIIIKKFFPKGELKSSSIGKNISRRRQIISEFSDLRFHFYSIVFDKVEIKKDSGLKHKESFIKFLNSRLYEVLYTSLSSMNIFADEHGSSDFMKSFEKYILDIIQENLFDHRTFQFVDSKKYPFIQIADFISGSLARFYDSKKFLKDSKTLIEMVRSKSLGIDEWPTKYNLKSFPTIRISQYSYDSMIAEQALRQAELFITRHSNSTDPDIELQVRTLKYLLFNFKYVNPGEYVSTKDIVEHLSAITNQEISLHKLRLSVIAKLRDSNIIVASSSNGYKIPINLSNMYDFAERTNSVVLPMLERIKKARKQYLFVSKNAVDILNTPRFDKLRKLVDENTTQ